MFRIGNWLAVAVVALGFAGGVSAQVVTFDFQDGTDQGFGAAFGNDASQTFAIDLIAGSNRMRVPQTPSFQEAGRESVGIVEPFFLAMQAASVNESVYRLTYDWFIDTSLFGVGAGNFLQVGVFVNSGSGYYAQDTPDVELNGAQVASGGVFFGTVDETFTARGFNIPLGENFFRIGLILNGDGANQVVHFDNITIQPVPEPSSLALLALTVPAMWARLRRRAASAAKISD